MCEDSVRGAQHHLWTGGSRPAYRGIRALRSSKPIPRSTAVRAESGRLLTEESEVKARWAGYFERLYQADPPAVKGVTVPVADPPINCGPPSFLETQAAVNRLKWGEAPGICGIHAELLKAGGNTILVSLLEFCALFGAQASSQLTGRGPCCPSLEREG